VPQQRNTPETQRRTAEQTRAWELRQHGWTQRRIAAELGHDQGTISRWLDAIERRELARLSRNVERLKVTQTQVLEHIADEALQAWERSKKPHTKAVEKTGPKLFRPDGSPASGSARVVEATERDGDPVHLQVALQALDRLRRVWGIDAPPLRPKDDGHDGLNFASVIQRLKENAAAYESGPESAGDEVSDGGPVA
jgi:DNA-binding MarR family transcriptional regulator